MVAILTNTTSLVQAEDHRLQIDIEAGLQGKVKRDKGFPITLTITNNGKDFSGDLTLAMARNYNSAGNKVIPIDIAAGATKKVQFSVPNMEELNMIQNGPNRANVQQFHLYEGDWQDGDEVPIDQSLSINPAYIQNNNTVIGVLTDEPDSLNYLKLLSFSGETPRVLHLNQEDLPEQAMGLDMLDILVIQDFPVASLSQQRQEALKNWLQKGGHIVTGSELGMAQQYGSLQEFLPLTVEGHEQVETVNHFNNLASFNPTGFELFTGVVKDSAEVLVEEEGTPLAIQQNVGIGKLTQFSYDISHPAFSDWEGTSEYWSSTLSISPTYSNGNSYNRLGDLSRYFQTLANFNLSTLVWLFLGYILLVVPILYLILKKWDKREWAWIIIPSLAILTSIGLYVTGAKDRLGDYKTKAVSVITVNENGTGYGTGSVSMLSKESGTYSLEVDSANKLFPTNLSGLGSNARVEDFPYMESGSETNRVYFQDVEFWSPRTALIDMPTKNYGQFEANLSIKGKQLSGTITNNFPYKMKELYIVGGQTYQKIGALDAGESMNLDIQMPNTLMLEAPDQRTAFQMFGRQAGQMNTNDENLKRDLLQVATDQNLFVSRQKPALIGFTEEGIVSSKVNGEETSEDHLNLITQPVDIKLSGGDGPISMELNKPELSIVEGRIRHNAINSGEMLFDATQGTYVLQYKIPDAYLDHTFKVNELSMQFQNRASDVSFAILNAKMDAYDSIDDTSLDQSGVNETYIEDGVITVRVTVEGSNRSGPIFVPSIQVEGVTNP